MLSFLSLAVWGCPSDPPRTNSHPNVVIFLADDLGMGDVGYLGSEIPTPHIDRLANNGLVFHRFYTEPYCTPSRAALLTGRNPIRYGLSSSVLRPWSESGLPSSETLLSETFQAANYYTALVGKWHLGHRKKEMHPNSRGFDHFYGHLGGRIDYFTHQVSYRKLDGQKLGLDWQRNGKGITEKGYSTDLLAQEAVKVVNTSDPGRPLFLLLSFNAPHPPLQATPQKLEEFKNIGSPQRQTYAAMVASLDDAVGDVTRALQEEGMLDNTLIVFMSDNGAAPAKGGRNGQYRGGKASTWEGGIRVPAFLHWPQKIPGGQHTQQLISSLDLLPTIASAVGVPVTSHLPLDGKDLWELIHLGATEPRQDLHFAALNGELLFLTTLRETWKLVREVDGRDGTSRERLFDLTDPTERNDVLAEQAKIASELSLSLDKWLALGKGEIQAEEEDPPVQWRPPTDWAKAAE